MFDPNKTTSKRKLLIWIFVFAQIFLHPSSTWALNATSFSPADNATGVSVSSNLSITFDYGWYDYNSGSIKIYYANGSLFESYSIGSGRISGGGSSTLTIDPTSNLTGSSSYYVMIDSNRIRDNYWMEYSIYSSTTWNFSTAAVGDSVAPTIVSGSGFRPADNSTEVLRDQNLIMTFSENVDLKSGNVLIKKLSDNSTVETISVTGGLVTGNGTSIITINPSGNLAFNTNYYITIANGVISDMAGNNFAGFSSNGTWNFRSETNGSWYDTAWQKRVKITTDATTVNGNQSYFPVYVNLNHLPNAFFNGVNTSGNDIIVTMANGTTVIPHEVVAISTTANTGELHFRAPTVYGADNTAFYIYYANSIASMPGEASTYGAQNVWNGNSYVGVWHLNQDPDGGVEKDSGRYSTNGTPANMTSEDPINGQVGKALDFDGSNECISMGDVSTVNFGSGDFTMSAWIKTDNTYATQMIVGKDTSGSRQFEFRTDSSRYLRTSYWTNPSQSWVYKDTDSSFLTDTNWHYVAMVKNGSSFETYKDGVLYASGTTSGSHSTIYDSTANLKIGCRDYAGSTNEFDGKIDEVRIASTSLSSNWINTEYNNQYATSTFYNVSSIIQGAPPDVTNPTVSSFSPADGATGVLVDSNFVITFSEAIDVQTGNIVIKKSSDDSTVQTIAVNSGYVTGNGTASITINPASDLDYNTGYYITIATTAFDDNSGNSYAGISDNSTWNFTTGSEAWYNGHWLYRKQITIQNSKVNGDLSNFPVMLNLNDFSGDFFDNVKSDGGDIVITSSDKTTKLYRELEYINTTTNQGILWFNAPNLYNTSNSIFYMYYGYSSAAETNSTSTWNSNYKIVLHLQETPTSNNSDTEFQDSTVNNIDVKSKGTMTSADKIAGQIGNGVDLDGVDDYLEYGDITSISLVSKFTLSAWVKPAGTASIMPVYSKGMYSVIDITHDISNWKGAPNYDGQYHYQNLARNTNWTYLVAVFDGTLSGNSRFKMYINGNPLSLTYSTLYARSGGESASLYAGYQNTMSYSGYYGALKFDESRVSNGAHSAAWVKTEYANQKSPSTFYSTGTQETDSGGGDVTAPTVSSFSPSDNSTSAAIDTNLIINFSENIDTQTGNITIKKLSDNTTVHTISIGSVSGNGTSTLTINPSTDLMGNTTYYVNIDATAIDDTAGNSYAGISNNGTWNFTTGTVTGWMNNSWTKRAKITVDDSKVNGSVYNFPVYIKLDNLSSTNFFNDTRTDGGDIRVTQGDGLTQLAIDLVYFDATNNLGELHFKAPYLSSTTNLDFYIYYGNSSARPINPSDPLGAHNVWNGFSAVYHLQQDPNGDVAAAIRNSQSSRYYGTAHGSMTTSDLVSCQLGKCYDFDGSNDFISFDDIGAIDNASKLTISGWVKRRSSGAQVTFGKGVNGSTTNRFDMELMSDGNVFGALNNSGNTYGYFASNDTNWHYLMAVYNGSGATNAAKLLMYFDSTAQSPSYSGTLPSTLAGNSAKFQIGRRVYDSTFTNGYVDEVRVAAKFRNKAWAVTEYNNHYSPSTFYSVNGTVGTNTDDSKPKITTTYPANRETQVPIRTNLVITFSENISANSGNIIIKRVSNGSTFATIAIGSTTVSGTKVTINPSDFAANTEYCVLLDEGIVVDGSSNTFSGISSSAGWRFTTSGSHIKETMMNDIGF